MPGPNEFMGLSRPPNSVDYAAPLAGFQIGDRLAGLPDIAQKYQERNAFPNGLKNPDGSSMNYMDIMNRGAQVQGTGAMNYISPLLQMQMYTQAGAGAAGELERGSPPPLGGGASAPQAGSPAAQPQAAASPKTVGAYLREAGLKDTEIAQFASQHGVSPGAPMVGNVASTVTNALDAFMRGAPGQTPASAVGASEVNQPAQAASATEQGANFSQRFATAGPQGTAGAPAVPTGGASGSPAPVGGPDGGPAPQPSRATPFMPEPKPQGPQAGQPGTQPADPAAGGGQRMAQTQQTTDLNPLKQLFPGASDPMAAAHARLRELDRGINNAATVGTRYGKIDPGAVAMAKAKIEGYNEERKSLTNALIKAGEPTEKAKDIASGATQSTETIKADTARYAKFDTGIQAMANTSVEMLPTLQAADSLLNAGAATGWAADKIQTAKQIMARIGGDPNGAMTLEAFGKQMSAFINQQTNNLKADSIEMGGSSMRLFQAQITNMQKASPSPDYTPAGNRYLIEVYRRGIDRATFLADKANEYKNAHDGRLDGNFEVWMRHWQTDHPMFSQEEVKNPKLVAPPTLQTPADAAKFGIKSGDPVRLPDGKIKYYHGPRQQQQQPQQVL